MAALSATCWGVSVQDRWIAGGKRHSRVKLDFSNAANTSYYPSGAGGIALPSHGVLGMKRNLESLVIVGGSGDAVHWVYTPSDSAIHGYGAPTALGAIDKLTELPTTWSPTLCTVTPVLLVEAVGW